MSSAREMPPVRPAWPLEPEGRLDFDASYEPVVMGKRLFLASPNDGSVTAYDTETGGEKWKFCSEGPVRCALACWKGSVFAGSDEVVFSLDRGGRITAGSNEGRLRDYLASLHERFSDFETRYMNMRHAPLSAAAGVA